MSTSPRAIDVLPDDRRDRTLIKLLLAHLGARQGRLWTSLDFPEERIHTRDAVQVIAMEPSGRVTAVEHVALEGLDGETSDIERFLSTLDTLEKDHALHVPEFHVDLAFSVDSVPSAADAKLMASSVRGWCERHLAAVAPGVTTHVVMVSRAPLKIQMEKTACPGEAGRVKVTRSRPPNNFEGVVRDRLEQKLPRLASASADRRVLLFEKPDELWSLAHLRLELQGASVEFPELNAVSEVWLAETASPETEGATVFRLVLKNGDE